MMAALYPETGDLAHSQLRRRGHGTVPAAAKLAGSSGD
jgi:hypothetical protein